MRPAVASVLLLGTSLVALPGCATVSHLPSPASATPIHESRTSVTLHGRPLTLHLATPATAGAVSPAALVLYASGDGGWFGTAVQMFRAIAAEGHPVVGLSSRAFLKIERPGHARLDPAQLVRDYATILGHARTALALPAGTPAILTGWSRGAAFAVLAAADTSQRTDAAGVVAIGLDEGENLAVESAADETDEDRAGPRTAAPFRPYDALARQVAAPSAVIQSSADAYLPAARARTLFGPETDTRRFYEVPGRNHRFDGAGRQLVSALGQALHWVVGAGTAPASAPVPVPVPAQGTDTVTVRGHALTVRTYGTRGARPVVVTSGDGGWIHLGPYVAESLARRGYFVVGIDARAYLSSFTSGATTLRPEDEPGDYRVFADFAARGQTRDRPVLIGVSEGAGLSLLAATDPRTREAIAGVVGLGLPDLNELGWHWRDALIYLTHRTPNEPLFSTARLASRVAPLPLAAIHSTRDEFVPLADIRRIVDAAQEPKRLWIVDAADHRFSDALPELDRRLDEALTWIARSRPPQR
jgi:fermentation-respiration switch protein FrsA (DUF1100 family)